MSSTDLTVGWFRDLVREEQKPGRYYDSRLWVVPTEEMFVRKERRPQLRNEIKFDGITLLKCEIPPQD